MGLSLDLFRGAFCIIVQGGIEGGYLLGSDRNRAIGRNSVVYREITTRIERARRSGIRANGYWSLARCIELLVLSLTRSRFRLRPNHQTASSFASPHSKPASCDSTLHILPLV